MKVILILSALLFSTTVWAANKSNEYKLEMELILDGKTVSKPTLHVLEGTKASVSSKSKTEKRYIDIVASESELNGMKGILMKFDVGVINSDGSPQLEFQPTILARSGEEAEIAIGDENGKEKMTLKVTAHRLEN